MNIHQILNLVYLMAPSSRSIHLYLCILGNSGNLCLSAAAVVVVIDFAFKNQDRYNLFQKTPSDFQTILPHKHRVIVYICVDSFLFG